MNTAKLVAITVVAVWFAVGQNGMPQNRDGGAAPSTHVPLSFDVISIRPDNSGSIPILQPTGDGIRARSVSVKDLIRDAFLPITLQDARIIGLPQWAILDKYDVLAKVTSQEYGDLRHLSEDDQRALRQRLLMERFGLKFHFESKEVAAFDLVVVKNGAKLKAAEPPPGFPSGTLRSKPGSIVANGVHIARLVYALMLLQDRPVIDRTGLVGSYQFVLEWQPDEAASLSSESQSKEEPVVLGASSGLPAALKDQLGLQLIGAREPVKVVVIDNINRPSEN